uniref:Secreted protein n=1 Tax=Timema poppense TaxID=170557 RepID=A0A7R9DYI8_TIMPO|nr:unnamed protein product [Timema poppensis]
MFSMFCLLRRQLLCSVRCKTCCLSDESGGKLDPFHPLLPSERRSSGGDGAPHCRSGF